MRKIINSIKRFFRKVAKYFVTIYANRLYDDAVRRAENVRKKRHRKAFVIVNPMDEGKLIAITSNEFKTVKRQLNIKGIRNTVIHMQNTCFYYTEDQFGKEGMSDMDKKIRRLAFVRYLIMRAKLY